MNILKKIVVALLTAEARLVLKRHKPRIIAVTGSVGKTGTKDAIFSALAPHMHVRKSEKSLNSDFGVPLAILGLESGWRSPWKWFTNIISGLITACSNAAYPRTLVLEVGADRPGDIKHIARWLRPDIVVLTHVPEVPVHVEFFKSPEDVVKEKRSLVQYIKPGGVVFVNGDDVRLKAALENYRGTVCTYGISSAADYSASESAIAYEGEKPMGMRFTLHKNGSSVPTVVWGALGLPRVYASLAAIAIADSLGINLHDASGAIGKWEPPAGRMRIVEGLKGATIIDDTYNSSPAAVLSALDTLRDVRARRRIAILGDMMELGKFSADAHRDIGMRAAACADVLITVGLRTRASVQAALDAGMQDGMVRSYEIGESARAGEELKNDLREGDVVLVKGSQSVRMERAVIELMAQPEHAKDLLVRQDEEWKKR